MQLNSLKKELERLYFKLLRWVVLTVIFILSAPMIEWTGFRLVIVGCCGYCLFLFSLCCWLQLKILKR
ncbi:hypothetical protein FD45_GL001924 [Liquorilactobacillus nagelii DSM 13675]|nr:hypothetical protein FD45_GL001924 [Liquorilactobacillus nagelii DSM 13675]